jgi:hypothetical protein
VLAVALVTDEAAVHCNDALAGYSPVPFVVNDPSLRFHHRIM